MKVRTPVNIPFGSFPLLVIFSCIALAAGFIASQTDLLTAISVVVAMAIFIAAFINTDIALYLLIFSMLLSPEFSVGATGGASLGRGVTIRMDDFLLVIIGLSWLAKQALNKELGLILKTPLNKPIFLYILACAIATGYGIVGGRVDPKTGFFFVLKYFEYFIVYFVLVNHVKNENQIRRLLLCLFLTCFIVSVYGMYQIPTGGRVSAPFEGETGEPNTFGGYLVFIGAVSSGLFMLTKNKPLKWVLGILLITIIPPFLYTESRSSYLAFIPAFFVLGFFHEKKKIVVGLMLIGLMISPFFLPQNVKDRILYTVTQREHSTQIQVGNVRIDTSTSARLNSWKDALANWPDRPLVGFGVTGYSFLDAQYPRVLIETGILGMIAFIYLVFSIFKLAIANLSILKTPDYRGLAIGFIAGFVGMLFHSIGANTFIIVRIMEPFWFVAGIIFVLPKIEKNKYSAEFSSTLETRFNNR